MSNRRITSSVCVAGAVLLGVVLCLPGSAAAIPLGWSCTGSCGTLGADGVVVDPPGPPSTYEWVSTSGGVTLGSADLNFGGETSGSILRSGAFMAAAGDSLIFNFNYVTSDGAGYADYAWARLLDAVTGNSVALLFTARTTSGGDTVPGFGMPPPEATLTPSSTPILPGTAWSPLGSSSGTCFDTGCGHTGWIESTYMIGGAGSYILEFGVVNWSDSLYQSGMAISGATVAGAPIDNSVPVPEPGSMILLGSGLVGLAGAVRRRTRRNAAQPGV